MSKLRIEEKTNSFNIVSSKDVTINDEKIQTGDANDNAEWQASMENEYIPNLVDSCYIDREFATSEEVAHVFDIYNPLEDSSITVDDVPTDNSENLVRSGGVKACLDNKVDKVNGKGLSANDYTTDEKNKLASLSNYDDTNLLARIKNLEDVPSGAVLRRWS